MTTYTNKEIEQFIHISKTIENKIHSKGMEKLLDVYHKMDIFKNLTKKEFQSIIYSVKFLQFYEKDFIMQEGEKESEIYYILSGQCTLIKKGKNISTLKEGQTFGENGLIVGETRRIASVVVTSQKIVVLSFKIDHTNTEFGSQALLKVYQNIMKLLKTKLEKIDII